MFDTYTLNLMIDILELTNKSTLTPLPISEVTSENYHSHIFYDGPFHDESNPVEDWRQYPIVRINNFNEFDPNCLEFYVDAYTNDIVSFDVVFNKSDNSPYVDVTVVDHDYHSTSVNIKNGRFYRRDQSF